MINVTFPFMNAALDMFGLFGYAILITVAVWLVLGSIHYVKKYATYSTFKKIGSAVALIILPLFIGLTMWNIKTTNPVKVYESSPKANYVPYVSKPNMNIPAAKSDKEIPDYTSVIKKQADEIKNKVGE